MASELASQYSPKDVEDKWYAVWEEKKYFRSTVDKDRPPFTIVIPPPNVTGALHMGHALNNTLQDIAIRFKKMQGCNALWLPGTDHAGIATQNVVEKELLAENLNRYDLGREKLIARIWEWKEQYGSRIIGQLKKLGSACDWDRERFTMDEGLSKAVKEAFIKLYEQGLIYKGHYIVNRCPRCETALADDEVEHKEQDGKLWYVKYPIKGEENAFITVATTRPETMLGDTAVAVHPDDERFKKYHGKAIVLPVMEREIPLILDEVVDPGFGTGAVKVTPAHDPTDFEIGKRHGLEELCVMNDHGAMNENAGKYADLDRFKCRDELVKELESLRLIDRIEDYTHSVGHCYRCHEVIEPYLSEQWFVKMKPLAKGAIEATESGKVTFHPKRWEKVYLSWLENVRDWCISRQIWWGHRIPAWYCESCEKIIVAAEAPQQCPQCESTSLRQDEDVLDTWFSSALWPFSTLGWPDDTDDLKYYYPTSVLVTDRGIIYFWVARMVMMGLKMMRNVPFSDVYIHGTILDEQGRKMSKSLGNGIDPLEMIDLYGADAVRFSLIMLTVEGQDVKLSPERFQMGRNFTNKLWNAGRLVMMTLDDIEHLDAEAELPAAALKFDDRWILSRLNKVARTATALLDAYKFNETLKNIYDFFWHDFCDWYLELSKFRFRSDNEADKQVAARVLAYVFDRITRLLHPFMPFITEELWECLGRQAAARGIKAAEMHAAAPSVMLAAWPVCTEEDISEDAENTMALIQGIVKGVRNIRSKMNIPPREALEVVIATSTDEEAELIRHHEQFMKDTAVIGELQVGTGLAKPESAAAEVIDTLQVFVPLSKMLVDVEVKRLKKQLAKKAAFFDRVSSKLRSASFLEKAPDEVVQREKDRREALSKEIETIKQNLESIS